MRSEWVGVKLGEGGSVLARGRGWEVELVEDLELGGDLDSVSRTLAKMDIKDGKNVVAVDANSSSAVDRGGKSSRSNGPIAPGSDTRRQPGSQSTTRYTLSRGPSTSSPTTSKVSIAKPNPIPTDPTPPDLLAGLKIYERPTPSTPTAAPVPTPTSLSPISAKTNPKRAPSSIVGEQSKLAQTVLKASKAINPIPQVNPDSEDEEEHQELEWERDVGLGWGLEDGEGGDVWEIMRAAREMEGE